MTPDILELLKQGGAVGILGVVLYYCLRFGAKQFERVVDSQIEALKALILTQKEISAQLHEHAVVEERQHGEAIAAIRSLTCYERKDDAA